jgi:hypothetical protein
LTDRTELLQLDIELLRAEVQSRKHGIENTNNYLVRTQLDGTAIGTNEVLEDDAKQSQIESLQKRLQDSRKEYLLKKKELSQRLSELDVLNEIQWKRNQEKSKRDREREAKQRTANDKRGARKEQPVPIQPVASDAPGISPVLEKRLSGIEGKLDNVLKALDDLKREMCQ